MKECAKAIFELKFKDELNKLNLIGVGIIEDLLK